MVSQSMSIACAAAYFSSLSSSVADCSALTGVISPSFLSLKAEITVNHGSSSEFGDSQGKHRSVVVYIIDSSDTFRPQSLLLVFTKPSYNFCPLKRL